MTQDYKALAKELYSSNIKTTQALEEAVKWLTAFHSPEYSGENVELLLHEADIKPYLKLIEDNKKLIAKLKK